MPAAHFICATCRIELASVLLLRGNRPAQISNVTNRKLQHVRALVTGIGSQRQPRQDLRKLRTGRACISSNVPNGYESHSAHEENDADRLRAIEKQREQDPGLAARAARQFFGDRLPEGVLTAEEYKIYERLYGPPSNTSLAFEEQDLAEDDSPHDHNVLLREGQDGDLETVQLPEEDGQLTSKHDRPQQPSPADIQLQKDIELSTQATTEIDPFAAADVAQEFFDDQDDEGTIRNHPFTLATRFGTSPSSIALPRAAMTGPLSILLSNLPNKHLDETAQRVFGGPGLPYSPATPLTSRSVPQKPIPLTASQGRMSEMEADVYMAAVMPGTYAAALSVLTELRRRLGTQWLEQLMQKEGGPKILDAGGAGAGVLAWREILKAEWLRIHEDKVQDFRPHDLSNTSAVSDQSPGPELPPTPLGKATVLTGSAPLRHRASLLLENTTFLPRLPDYVHARFPSEDTHRKQFDIIIAPHSLWHMQENYERREKVLNLWSLLDPKGGILVLIEKGVPQGFQIVAEARSYMLRRLFSRPDGMQDLDNTSIEEDISQLFDQEHSTTAKSPTSPPSPSHSTATDLKMARRAPARIIAPCPGHAKCPMYLDPGVAKQRKDYCHFSQRFIRPSYYQRLLGAKHRNHEDVEFSYVAVQKGIADTEPTSQQPHDAPGKVATDRAFTGYDLADTDLVPSPSSSEPTASATRSAATRNAAPITPDMPLQIPHRLPRILLPPLKRKGHVHLDLCLPTGAMERWTVPRSFGQHVYRDARKARWGDLWALGAKQRENRRLRRGSSLQDVGSEDGALARGMPGAGGAAEGGDEDGDFEEEGSSQKKKKGGKLRGRLKARTRRREEKKAWEHGRRAQNEQLE